MNSIETIETVAEEQDISRDCDVFVTTVWLCQHGKEEFLPLVDVDSVYSSVLYSIMIVVDGW